jgi:phosphoenolpyruvate carboxykinase (ATP)
MNINYTRAMVRAALDGRLAKTRTRTDPIFGFEVPLGCPDVPTEFLDPRATWADKDAYDRQAAKLAAMFVANFETFASGTADAVRAAGPSVSGGTRLPEIESDPGVS